MAHGPEHKTSRVAPQSRLAEGLRPAAQEAFHSLQLSKDDLRFEPVVVEFVRQVAIRNPALLDDSITGIGVKVEDGDWQAYDRALRGLFRDLSRAIADKVISLLVDHVPEYRAAGPDTPFRPPAFQVNLDPSSDGSCFWQGYDDTMSKSHFDPFILRKCFWQGYPDTKSNLREIALEPIDSTLALFSNSTIMPLAREAIWEKLFVGEFPLPNLRPHTISPEFLTFELVRPRGRNS